MESHSCIKTRGEGVPGALPMPNPAIGVLPEIDNDDYLRCRHIDALGRRCRMFVATPEITSGDAPDDLQDQAAELCPHHAQRILRRQRATEATAAELLASVSDFTDPACVNRFLGNLIKLVAVKRIPRKNAVALAYISQLILNSQAAQDRRELMRLRIAELDAQQQRTYLPASFGIFPCAENATRAGSPGRKRRQSWAVRRASAVFRARSPRCFRLSANR